MDRASLISAMRATAALPPVAIETKEWGTVYVRQVTVAEVDQQQAEQAEEGEGKKNNLARGACRVLCNATGERLFDAASKDDVALLAAQPWALLRKVLAAADGGSGNG